MARSLDATAAIKAHRGPRRIAHPRSASASLGEADAGFADKSTRQNKTKPADSNEPAGRSALSSADEIPQ